METFMPQQRKEIYETMLNNFEKDVEYNVMSGFCREIKDYAFPANCIDYYPELMKQKPLENKYGCYWWPIGTQTEGRDRRIEVLKKAIKLVNKLI